MTHMNHHTAPSARGTSPVHAVPAPAAPSRGAGLPAAGVSALLATLVALLLVLATPGPASAHDELLSTTPEAGASIAKAPTTLDLTFSGNIQDIGSEVHVTDSHGTDVTRGTLAVQGTKVSQPLREGGDTDETYTVTWRVVSQDGHPIEGTFSYNVGDGAGSTASPAPVVSGTEHAEESPGAEDRVAGTGIPGWVLPVIGGVIALVVLLVVLAVATRPRQR